MKKIKRLSVSLLVSALLLMPVGQAFACEDHEKIELVSAGSYHSLALKSDGTVWAWGHNLFGQLGDGSTYESTVPKQVSGLDNVLKIDAGSGSHSLALKKDGTVWAWGANGQWQVGSANGSTITAPAQIEGLNEVKDITAGSEFNLVLKENGTVWAWGKNELGLGDKALTKASKIPVEVANLEDVKKIKAGSFHSLALKNDGTVWAWGDNQYGQSGLGKNTYNSKVPVQIEGMTDIIDISTGYNYSLALKSDGTVWAWGENSYEQLGINNKTTQYTPVQVMNLENVTEVEAGRYYSFAKKEDGTVWAWGSNGHGGFGNGEITNYSLPVEITNLKGYKTLSSGNVHSLGVSAEGAAFGWGGNPWGQIGDGTKNNKHQPIQVLGQ
ncbi:RCC1 repeat- and reductase domain-containing protein [Brevibacillus sp. AG]|uniref:RCC1 domain-containing protein n=1 Tax=Brevibacillus sp. AG TaxID=3020891 RepID=UPI000852CF40|nr:hypothetical protein [Brevibacillus sp. AG]MDC0762564.1 RCC1 repeat- and reductase domain-containing protein [Brevibacillus sp. AG]